jgi:hypothetical protein
MPTRTYDTVVKAFAKARDVTRETRKGFGSGALKVRDKIFAMMTPAGLFVVKLPKARVETLVAAGVGTRFEPGPGRVMKEWLVVESPDADWVELAKEARTFVGGGRSSK